METRISRLRSSSIQSRSDSEKRSISTSPRRGPSSPVQTNDSDDDRDLSTNETKLKTNEHDSSSTIMSDTEDEQEKKRSHRHRHHHHRHHHHKQSKSNKRPATHQKHSVKRTKRETISTKHEQQSDDEKSVSSVEKISSQSEQSQSDEEIISNGNHSHNDDDDDEEEGIIQGASTPDERRHRHHRRKKQRRSSSTNDEPTSPTNQSSASIPVPKNNKGTQLIVNYLPASLRESDFYQLFARVAPIKLCKLITDRQTGHSFCYGFIEYHSKEDAVKAIEKFNGYRVEHKTLKVSYAQPKSTTNNDNETNTKHLSSSTPSSSSSSTTQKNSNIYITNLPENFDEKMLERLFSKYGEIVQTKVLRDPRTKVSRGVGFVLMTSTRYAERAVKALDGYVPSGTTTSISVKYADPKKTANANDDSHSPPSSSRLSRSSPMGGSTGPYGYPPSLPPMNIMDPYYTAALHRHHHHRAAMNMRDLSLSPPPPPPPSYYGSSNSSTSRSSRMRGSPPDLSRSYSASSSSKHNSSANNSSSRSANLSSSLQSNRNTPTSLAAAYDLIAKGCQQAIDPNGFVIYAFGLPNECDENDLEELFRRYGNVYRVYIVRNYSTGESKGYSFVTMSNYDEACHAVSRLDGSTFQGRTIQVRFKQ